jgi:cell division protein YceG involved in septum cleavage
MDENAEHQNQSLPQEQPPEVQEAKKEKTGRTGVSKYVPAIVWLTTVFFVGMVIGNFLWLVTADVLAFGREDRAVEITIESTDTLKDISNKLAQEGLVSYPGLFRLFARVSGTAERFGPGTYQLNAKYDYPALAKVLAKRTVRTAAPLPHS